MEYTIQDIIDATVENEPTKVQAAFDHIVGQRVMDALEARKQDIASSMFNAQQDTEEIQDSTPEETEAEHGEEDTTSAEEENNQPA